jgi:hypothetical protein
VKVSKEWDYIAFLGRQNIATVIARESQNLTAGDIATIHELPSQ